MKKQLPGKRLAREVESEADEDFELSKAQRRELKRRIADYEDPTRYLIESRIGKTFVSYYNVTDDVYAWKNAVHATLFKRRKAALAIQKLLGRGTRVISCTTRRRKGQLIPVIPRTRAGNARK